MSAPTIPDPGTTDDAGVPPAPPEAHQRAIKESFAELGLGSPQGEDLMELVDLELLRNTKPRFGLGMLCMTRGACSALERVGKSPLSYIARHVSGDWSEMDEEDQMANEVAVQCGSRILSAYRLPDGAKIWVITEADRSATTLLLPLEY